METQTSTTTMRAVVHERYGGPEVLHVETIPRPAPADGDLLIEVRATTVNRTDSGFRRAEPFIVRPFSGLVRPKYRVLGTEFAGVVRAVGAGVDRFAAGDEVFGVHEGFGAHAEYLCVGQTTPVALKPADLSFDEAAAVCDGVVLALSGLRAASVGEGTRLLVYGASGSIGTAAVQLAKYHFGAHVTAVCNTANVELARSLGADRVIDYTSDEFIEPGVTYDVILDAVGKRTFRHCRPALAPGGIYMNTDLGVGWQNPILALCTSWTNGRRVLFPIPKYTQADVELLKGLLEAGKYRAVIDRTYPLDQVVEATRYVETEQKTGNVVLTVGH